MFQKAVSLLAPFVLAAATVLVTPEAGQAAHRGGYHGRHHQGVYVGRHYGGYRLHYRDYYGPNYGGSYYHY